MIKITTLLTISALVLIGCGGGGGSTPIGSPTTPNEDWKDKTYDVTYTFNGTKHPTCPNTIAQYGLDDSSTFFRCQWRCGRYEGASPVAVILAFGRHDANSTWELHSEHVSTAQPQCKP